MENPLRDALERIRDEKSWTNEQLAEAIRVKPPTISRIFNGKTGVTDNIVEKVRVYLNRDLKGEAGVKKVAKVITEEGGSGLRLGEGYKQSPELEWLRELMEMVCAERSKEELEEWGMRIEDSNLPKGVKEQIKKVVVEFWKVSSSETVEGVGETVVGAGVEAVQGERPSGEEGGRGGGVGRGKGS